MARSTGTRTTWASSFGHADVEAGTIAAMVAAVERALGEAGIGVAMPPGGDWALSACAAEGLAPNGHPSVVGNGLLLIFGGVVDEPDWVSWRWLVGLGGALAIVGAWLFGFGDPVWMSVPMLLALVVPRRRDGSRISFSLRVLLVQKVPFRWSAGRGLAGMDVRA